MYRMGRIFTPILTFPHQGGPIKEEGTLAFTLTLSLRERGP